MVAAAVVGSVVGSVASGVIGSNAAEDAAETQANAANNASQASLTATRETNDLNWKIYQQNLANQSPAMRTGNMALSALQSGLGLGSATNAGQQQSYTGQPADGSYAKIMQNDRLPNGASYAGTGANINYGASNADMAMAGDQYANRFTKTFAPSDLTTDPSYKWRLEQGNAAIASSAAARGLTGSGQNLKDIANYSQGAASQEYSNAFDRFNTNQATLYNRLAGLAGVGQTAVQNAGAAGAQVGQTIGQNTVSGVTSSNNALTSGAAAQAAGQVGAANAWGGAINNGINGWATLQGMQTPAAAAAPVSLNAPMGSFSAPNYNLF